MIKHSKLVLILSLLLLIFLLGCSTKSDPAQSVSEYLSSLVNQNADGAVAVSCADWEENARLETDSFLSVDAILNNVTCQTIMEGDTEAEVTCNGMIDMTYNEEVRSIDLSLRTYTLIYQSGEWRVCGYK